MKLQTTSEVISLLRELENGSVVFYEALVKVHAQDKEIFFEFVKESKKNITNIERTYFGVITDALEGCFAFDIEPEQYRFPSCVGESETYTAVLSKALDMEKKIIHFYIDAAAQSKSLMADVPRVMERIARARGERQKKLQSLF
jgi:hypothetical protein